MDKVLICLSAGANHCRDNKSFAIPSSVDTVEVWGSSPHGPTISFSEFASTTSPSTAPNGSIKHTAEPRSYPHLNVYLILEPLAAPRCPKRENYPETAFTEIEWRAALTVPRFPATQRRKSALVRFAFTIGSVSCIHHLSGNLLFWQSLVG
jgi:hypothetical protein